MSILKNINIETPGKRLRMIRTQLGITQKEFGQKLGLAWYQVKNMELGTANISPSMAKLVYYETGYNTDWLLKGEGEMKSFSIDQDNVFCLDIIEKTLDRVMEKTGIYVEDEEKQLILKIIKKELINDLSKMESKAEKKILDFLNLVSK